MLPQAANILIHWNTKWASAQLACVVYPELAIMFTIPVSKNFLSKYEYIYSILRTQTIWAIFGLTHIDRHLFLVSNITFTRRSVDALMLLLSSNGETWH
jgi:hypothetical protein